MIPDDLAKRLPAFPFRQVIYCDVPRQPFIQDLTQTEMALRALLEDDFDDQV
jgi:hypothetical protein